MCPAAPSTHYWLQRHPYSTLQPPGQEQASSTRHWPQGLRILPMQCTSTSNGKVSLHRRTLHTGQRAASSRWGHLTSAEDARKFLASMPVPQRLCLERAVLDTRKEQEGEMESAQDVTTPTWKQLKLCELKELTDDAWRIKAISQPNLSACYPAYIMSTLHACV